MSVVIFWCLCSVSTFAFCKRSRRNAVSESRYLNSLGNASGCHSLATLGTRASRYSLCHCFHVLNEESQTPCEAPRCTQTDFCIYLSAILLGGLLNAIVGLWWADPVAALIMVPIIAREGIEGIQGEACQHCP